MEAKGVAQVSMWYNEDSNLSQNVFPCFEFRCCLDLTTLMWFADQQQQNLEQERVPESQPTLDLLTQNLQVNKSDLHAHLYPRSPGLEGPQFF